MPTSGSSIVPGSLAVPAASGDSGAGAGIVCAKCARRWRWWQRWLLKLAVLVVLFCGMYLFRSQLFTLAAQLWIVNEPLQRADAIVVLGGGMTSRPAQAARLYEQGYAAKILVMTAAKLQTDGSGVSPDKVALLAQGVPESSIVVVGRGVASTFDEAAAVAKWAETSGARRVLVPTQFLYTRRIDWIFDRKLKSLKGRAITISMPAEDYTPSNWWKNEDTILTVQNEILRYFYYRAKY
jgi:uncharacterized SAM-binding protein YcdF (DUF218 family)